METLTNITKKALAVLGVLSRLFLIIMSSVFAGFAVVAFVGIFHDSIIINLIGCVAAGCLAYVCWEVKDDIPVKIK